MSVRLRELLNTATPGPWAWFGRKSGGIYLATVRYGRRFVLTCDVGDQPRFQKYLDREGHPSEWNGRMLRAGDLAVVPRSYRDDISRIDNADAELIALAPTLAARVVEAIDLLRLACYRAEHQDALCGVCPPCLWLARVDALDGKDAA